MSSASVWRHHDHKSDIEVHAEPSWRDVIEQVVPALTEEGQHQMYAEVGKALLASIATGNDEYVNKAVEAWLRTLVLKLDGMDEILDKNRDWVEGGDESEVYSLDELRDKYA